MMNKAGGAVVFFSRTQNFFHFSLQQSNHSPCCNNHTTQLQCKSRTTAQCGRIPQNNTKKLTK